MNEPDLISSLIRVIDELVSMLGPENSVLATRLRDVAGELRQAPPGDPDGGLARNVRRLTEGTMGSLSDVMLGSFHGRRWVLDRDRDATFSALRRELGALIARLPPPTDAASGDHVP
jgi:hypothetical protein